MHLFNVTIFIFYYVCIVGTFLYFMLPHKKQAINILYGHILAVLCMGFLYMPRSSKYYFLFHLLSIAAFSWSNFFVIEYLMIDIGYTKFKKRVYFIFFIYSIIDSIMSRQYIMLGIISHKFTIISAYLILGILMIRHNKKRLLGVYITGAVLIFFTLSQYVFGVELLFRIRKNLLTGQIFYILQAISLTMVFLLSFIEERFRENIQALSQYEVEEEIDKDRDFFMNKMRERLSVPLTTLDKLLLDFEENTNYEDIESIKKYSFNVAKITNHLIELSKLQLNMASKILTKENIVTVIEEITLATVEYFEEKNIYLQFDTDCEEVFGYIDVEKIQCAILCILTNSAKFSPENQVVTVKVTHLENVIEISFSNISSPVEKNILENINNPIDRSNKIAHLTSGTGLGLSLAKNLLALHKGNLAVQYEYPIFKTRIILPVVEDASISGEKNNLMKGIDKSMVYMEFSDVY